MTLRDILKKFQREYSCSIMYSVGDDYFESFNPRVEATIRCYNSDLDKNISDFPDIRSINVGEKKGKKLVCVVFVDGSHIINMCHKEDDFDINVGVALCLIEKYFGSKNKFHKFIKSKLTENSKLKLEEWKEDDKTRENNSRSIR